MGTLLRAGVLLAAAVVLLGGTLFLGRHGSGVADYRVFHGAPSELRTVPGILTEALAGRGRGFIQLGLLMLIVTPIARVALALVVSSCSATDSTRLLRSSCWRSWRSVCSPIPHDAA